MPTYAYKCPACRYQCDVFKRIAELDRAENCRNCNSPMSRQISAPAVRGDYAGYACPITGEWVEGRRAHAENLKKHGCRVLETGETEGAKRSRAAADAALDASVESSVEEFIETLPAEKKEQLAVEVQSGLDVEIVRS